jgi:GAF domain-containing protein
MLDVPIRAGRGIVGILCAEHVGGPRSWSLQEKEFSLVVAQILATNLEASARNRAENREQQAILLSDVTAALAETLDVKEAARLVRRMLRGKSIRDSTKLSQLSPETFSTIRPATTNIRLLYRHCVRGGPLGSRNRRRP